MAFYIPAQTPFPMTYIFIDGASLTEAMASLADVFFDSQPLAINWTSLRAMNRKAYYYDAIPLQTQEEDENAYATRTAPKRAELATIERQGGYHVRTGDVRRRKKGNEQKMVDVQLSVDALLMASRGLFSGCTLISSDLDFYPLIGALVEMGIDVTLQYQPGHTNSELLVAADNVRPLTLNNSLSFLDLTPDQKLLVPKVAGVFQQSDEPLGTVLVEWDDERFGNCVVHSREGKICLLTQREPHNPTTHRLVAEAASKKWLRAFLAETHDLEIPDWS